MSASNRLEMVLALNAEAFKKGLGDVGSRLRTMAGTIAGIVAPITASVSALAGMHKLVDVTREFDKLSAGLLTATGSAEGSKQAFDAIQDFATKTPYDLAQVTDSFVKLVNFGLDPSERAMTSYGNTSSALGKELNQMIEAVADAATGEFERLKEFGIKSKSEGDKVSFTFRGITTTVGKNAKEIEEYLIKLGETNFGSAMANRMSTLDGALSNLGDAWDKLFLTISQKGIGNAITSGVNTGISALEILNAMISSGEMEGYLQASISQWSGWADDINASINLVGRYFDGEMNTTESRGKGAVQFLTDAFREFPENVRAFVGMMTVLVASEFDKVKADAKAFKDGVAALFTDNTVKGVLAERDRQYKIIDQARDSTIDGILKERQADIDSAKARVAAAKELRAEYEKRNAAAKADTSDRTAKFKVNGDASGGASTESSAKETEITGRTPLTKEEADAAKKSADEQIAAAEEVAAKKEELRQEDLAAQEAASQKEAYLRRERHKDSLAEMERDSEERKAQAESESQERLDAALAHEEELQNQREQADEERRERNRRAAEERRQENEEYNERLSQEDEEAQAKPLENNAAGEWADAQAAAAEKATGAVQKYYDKVMSLQDEILGREKSLSEELDGLDTRGTEESRWRKRAKDAREYEKAARVAMKAGDLDRALSFSDQARELFSSLKGGAGKITDETAQRSAYGGVKSSGELGLAISRMLQQVSAKGALAAMPAGGGQGTAGSSAVQPAAKVHELRFAGGSLRGGEEDINNLLKHLANAGLNTA